MRIREQLALFLVLAPTILWVVVFVSALVRGPVTLCPRCGSQRFRHSLKRMVDAAFPSFVPAYRCENCKKRFRAITSFDYTRGVESSHKPAPAP
jgi:DNA-directed RNA polymerase subunit RPC12/RpoP